MSLSCRRLVCIMDENPPAEADTRTIQDQFDLIACDGVVFYAKIVHRAPKNLQGGNLMAVTEQKKAIVAQMKETLSEAKGAVLIGTLV